MWAKGKSIKKVNIDFERRIQVGVNPIPLYQLGKKASYWCDRLHLWRVPSDVQLKFCQNQSRTFDSRFALYTAAFKLFQCLHVWSSSTESES